ncbi:hypothetical protein [Jannaschia seohaensis]|uniref:ART-PolyVal-like domain-containing protein n=1 Tax=Jannaschia seohaensis TaxID=475081 RepID=A0A2Y9B7Z1_9RHOB|nr:hypothetical protein [Jannaschia seohaensis]PWJ13806.1 hypothetical protein BCF38_11337 [Jannaschia seohaensis]SSA50319.1 hypothetical protein SAMN05421539_11337 [Jannaschia seohaensis]
MGPDEDVDQGPGLFDAEATFVEPYGDRSVIVRGVPREAAEVFSDVGVRPIWNQGAQGWVFPARLERDVTAALAEQDDLFGGAPAGGRDNARDRAEIDAWQRQSRMRRGDQQRVENDEDTLFGRGAQGDLLAQAEPERQGQRDPRLARFVGATASVNGLDTMHHTMPDIRKDQAGDDAAKWLRGRGATNLRAREYALAVNGDGDVIAIGSGGRSSIGFGPAVAAVTDPEAGIVFHHTHPRGTSFSSSDISALAHGGIAVVYAHGTDGSTYRAEMTPNGRALLMQGVNNTLTVGKAQAYAFSTIRDLRGFAAGPAHQILQAEFTRRVNEGADPTEVSNALAVIESDAAMRVLHDEGVIISERQGRNDLEQIAGLDAAHDQARREVRRELQRLGFANADRPAEPVRRLGDMEGFPSRDGSPYGRDQGAERARDRSDGDGQRPQADRPDAERQPRRRGRPRPVDPRQGSLFEEAEPFGTDAFRQWFGDSAVTDADGNPRVVYHGTTAGDFEAFDPARSGSATGAADAREGFFFSASPEVASTYAAGFDAYRDNRFLAAINALTGGLYRRASEGMLRTVGMSAVEPDGTVMPVYLSIQNPLEVDVEGAEYRADTYAEIVAKAKEGGHDGLVIRNARDEGFGPGGDVLTDVFVAFEPEQVKSTFNRDTFDAGDPRISMQEGDGSPDPDALARALPAMRAALDKAGLKRVNLRVDARAEGWQGAFINDGISAGEIVIGASLDPTATLHHEVIHALRAMKAFTDAEWTALHKAAADEWMEKHDIRARYPDLAPFEQIEEAIAEEFGAWASAQEKPRGMVGLALQKIRRVLDAIRGALTGAGYNTPEDIFGRIVAGRIAARGAETSVVRAPGAMAWQRCARRGSRSSPMTGAKTARVQLRSAAWARASSSRAPRCSPAITPGASPRGSRRRSDRPKIRSPSGW